MSAAETANPKAVGKVIKAWRRRRKLTQKELAAGTGLQPGAISAFERGESAPNLVARKKLCAALEVELRDFDAEVSRVEGDAVREAPGKSSGPETLNGESISNALDTLKPLFLKIAERFLREEEARNRLEGSKP